MAFTLTSCIKQEVNAVDMNAYEMVFEEQFVASAVEDISRNWKHTYYWGDRTLGGNGEQQIYIDKSYGGLGMSPFSIGNGVLTITAAKTPSDKRSRLDNKPYTSGMISSEKLFSMQYGYFEIRAKMPAGKGLWPAFWLLPIDGSWPPELDVVEILGHEPSRLYGTLHHTGSDGGHKTVHAVDVTKFNSSTGFHTYAVDWQPSKITWYYDGVEVGSTSNPVKNQPMYLIANLAVGGYWPGNPDSKTKFPAKMEIDYIRAYRKKDAVSPRAWPKNWKSSSTQPFSTLTTSGAKSTWAWAYTFNSNDVKVRLNGEWSRYLTGNSKDNVLVGSNAPYNRLDGRGGNDVLEGGPGTDVFVVRKGEGNDTILDFSNVPGNTDKLELHGFEVSSFDRLRAWAMEVPSGTILRLSSTQSVFLKGRRISDLSAEQFVFVN